MTADLFLAAALLASAPLMLWRWCRRVGIFWTEDDPEFYGCTAQECAERPARHCCKMHERCEWCAGFGVRSDANYVDPCHRCLGTGRAAQIGGES